MPTWLTQLGAAAAVVYIVVFLVPRFLKQLKEVGDSKDKALDEYLKTLNEAQDKFLASLQAIEEDRRKDNERSSQIIMQLIGLSQSMINRCQMHVPPEDRVTSLEMMEIGSGQRAEHKPA